MKYVGHHIFPYSTEFCAYRPRNSEARACFGVWVAEAGGGWVRAHLCGGILCTLFIAAAQRHTPQAADTCGSALSYPDISAPLPLPLTLSPRRRHRPQQTVSGQARSVISAKL